MARGARYGIWFTERNNNPILEIDKYSDDNNDEDNVDDESSTESNDYTSEHENNIDQNGGIAHTYPTRHPIAGVVEEKDDNGDDSQDNDAIEDMNDNGGNDKQVNDANDSNINDESKPDDEFNDEDNDGENTDSQQNIDATMSPKYGPRSA